MGGTPEKGEEMKYYVSRTSTFSRKPCDGAKQVNDVLWYIDLTNKQLFEFIIKYERVVIQPTNTWRDPAPKINGKPVRIDFEIEIYDDWRE